MKRSRLKFLFPWACAALGAHCSLPPENSQLASGIMRSPEFVIPPQISARSRQLYHLFGSTDLRRSVIYYLPASGHIASANPGFEDSTPDFGVSSVTFTNGSLTGQTALSVGGGFSVGGSLTHLRQLEKEARSAGYDLMPAPANAVRTSFSIVSKDLVQDFSDQFGVSPIAIRVWQPQFKSSGPIGVVGFQALIHPNYVRSITEKLKRGAHWGDLIAAQVDWQLKDEKLTHKAIIETEFHKVHDFISSQFNVATPWVEVQLRDLFEKLVTCGGIEKCGVSVRWFDGNGRETSQPTPKEGLLNLVTQAQKEMRDQLFQKIVDYKNELGVAENKSTSAAFFKYSRNSAHYEMHHRDRREIYYNPGSETFEISTRLVLGCVVGKPDDVIRWQLDDPSCKSVVDVR